MPLDATTMGEDAGNGILSRIRAVATAPIATPLTWTRLALIVGFVLVAALMWRQVIGYIAEE